MEAELKSQLNEDLKQALRTGDKVKLSVIRLVLAAIKNAEMARQEKLMSGFLREHQVTSNDDEAKRKAILDVIAKQAELVAPQTKLQNPDVLDVIAKQAKQREESIAAYKQANRLDLASQEEAELVVLKTYLPQAAGHDDILAVVRQVIAEVGAQGQKDKGRVMQKAIALLKGRADGRAINEVVTELLK
jgi:uncharacterized protein YqeY